MIESRRILSQLIFLKKSVKELSKLSRDSSGKKLGESRGLLFQLIFMKKVSVFLQCCLTWDNDRDCDVFNNLDDS